MLVPLVNIGLEPRRIDEDGARLRGTVEEPVDFRHPNLLLEPNRLQLEQWVLAEVQLGAAPFGARLPCRFFDLQSLVSYVNVSLFERSSTGYPLALVLLNCVFSSAVMHTVPRSLAIATGIAS